MTEVQFLLVGSDFVRTQGGLALAGGRHRGGAQPSGARAAALVALADVRKLQNRSKEWLAQ